MSAAPAGRLVIATRASRLALWQAEFVQSALRRLHPGMRVELLPMTTTGDERLDVSLDKVGGKGLFIKELEAAMLDGRADLAVHSMKDMPADLPPGFMLAAITARDDPRDAFVSPQHASLEEMPDGAVLGTSSLRRSAQVAQRRPGLVVRGLRGNVNTRLAKLDAGEFAGIILAAAGLNRLGLAGRIRGCLSVELSIPAAGQAALGIECLAARKDVAALVAPLAEREATLCVSAERAVNRALGGNCSIPLGAHAELHGAELRLRAIVAAPDGRSVARAECSGHADAPEALGERAAAMLRERGADAILAALTSA